MKAMSVALHSHKILADQHKIYSLESSQDCCFSALHFMSTFLSERLQSHNREYMERNFQNTLLSSFTYQISKEKMIKIQI